MLGKIRSKLNVVMTQPSYKYSYMNEMARSVLLLSDREQLIFDAFKQVARSHDKVNYLEFGVFEGRSFITAYYASKSAARRWGKKIETRFYAFDTFAGLPGAKGIDKTDSTILEGDMVCSVPQFKKNLHKNHVPLENVEIVEGLFTDTCTKELQKKIGFATLVYLDGDYYESAKVALDFISNLLVDGAIVISDDWWCYNADPRKGEQRAFAEWKKKNPQLIISPYKSVNSFVVHHRKKR